MKRKGKKKCLSVNPKTYPSLGRIQWSDKWAIFLDQPPWATVGDCKDKLSSLMHVKLSIASDLRFTVPFLGFFTSPKIYVCTIGAAQIDNNNSTFKYPPDKQADLMLILNLYNFANASFCLLHSLSDNQERIFFKMVLTYNNSCQGRSQPERSFVSRNSPFFKSIIKSW